MIRIGLAQINPTIGDVAGNLGLLMDAAVKASASGVELLALPELTLIGYPPKDMLFDERLIIAQDQALAQVLAFSRQNNMAIALGIIIRNEGAGKPLFNAMAVIRNGGTILIYRKQLLPTYDVFDERRYFEPGQRDIAIIDINGHRAGFLICEDGWNFEGTDYATDPVADLKSAGADFIVSINASPFFVNKPGMRLHTLMRSGLPIAYVNQVGGNDDLVFDGNSFFGDTGLVRLKAAGFEPDMIQADFDGARFVASNTPVTANESEAAQMFSALSLGLHDYLDKTGFSSVVIGSSGGIDSALVIAISALALGPERVTAITMPSRYSSAGSIDDSKLLCEKLGVKFINHSIKEQIDAFEKGFASAFGKPLTGLAAENLQARIRGTVLMEYSNAFGALLISTGNKSEMSVGYCTLYGDMNGGIGLIGDLYKTDVYELSRWINQNYADVIPAAIMEKAPSAELAPGQKDQDSLPPYEILDPLLKELLENGPPSNAEKVLRDKIEAMLSRAEFKRRQAPPVIKVRSRSFGAGRQYPIAARYPS